MIYLYTGTVGSGKSYHALETGLHWIKRNSYVIANFPILPPKKFMSKRHQKRWENLLQRWIFLDEISPEILMAKSFEFGWFGKESSCMVIIDEAGVIFNSRDWMTAKGTRDKWIKFLSQSRKFGYDFVMVSQSDRMIDRQIRGFVEYEVLHRKMNNSKMFGWLSLFKLSVFMYIYKWYGTKLKAKLDLSVFKSYIANRYDTMRVFNIEDLINSMKRIFEGKVIPSGVAVQLQLWEKELLEKEMRKREEEEKQKEILENRSKKEEELDEKIS